MPDRWHWAFLNILLIPHNLETRPTNKEEGESVAESHTV